MRAEFRIWHVGEECHFAVFDPSTKKPIFLDQDPPYPMACERINELMRELLAVFKDDRMIRHKIFQAELVASTSGEALLCLVYRKKLDDEWKSAAMRMAERLTAKNGQKCHVVGRSKGKKIVAGDDHVVQWQEVRVISPRGCAW
jgi:tRNA (uracil-5-)-methyltransferase